MDVILPAGSVCFIGDTGAQLPAFLSSSMMGVVLLLFENLGVLCASPIPPLAFHMFSHHLAAFQLPRCLLSPGLHLSNSFSTVLSLLLLQRLQPAHLQSRIDSRLLRRPGWMSPVSLSFDICCLQSSPYYVSVLAQLLISLAPRVHWSRESTRFTVRSPLCS